MRTLGIVQARMGSSRLPGKVLRRLGRQSVLARVVDAARRGGVLDDLVVATTVEPADDAVVAECEAIGVAWYRGPVDDVLTRFVGALRARGGADAVMRFTADCPLLDPAIVALAARVLAAAPDVDYLSTSITRTLPRGLDVEIVRTAALHAADELASGHHRVHVTSFLYSHPQMFRVLGLTVLPDHSDLRLTLDTEDDWELIAAVVAHLGDEPVPLARLAGWLAERPELRRLNAHIRQKALVQG
ncbi:MAG TPA: NTP transferase domain-containing protein [Pilimelia sp.]|nr:NTP transferase domain-containing protein [Pilimelia sp.]